MLAKTNWSGIEFDTFIIVQPTISQQINEQKKIYIIMIDTSTLLPLNPTLNLQILTNLKLASLNIN